MWKILQQKKSDDYVIATGKQYSIRTFVNLVAKKLGIKIKWTGKGLKEKAIDLNSKRIIIEVDKNYFRPLDVNTLLGNSSKARKKLKWFPKFDLKSLVDEMIKEEEKIINEN